VQIPRLEALQNSADHYSNDPYTLSSRVRKKFRTEKKLEKELSDADDVLKGQYALPEELKLLRDDETARTEARMQWEKAKEQARLQESTKRKREMEAPKKVAISMRTKGSGSSTIVNNLRARILENTTRQRSLGSSLPKR
jgi:coiled-coil domain-containing protein 130